ncbi:MAG TPA: hypothetical protein VKI19_00160, partial [Acidimicrobiales bacterium]|nr:hypothetical protein [Acidimicrobiales bacterium]
VKALLAGAVADGTTRATRGWHERSRADQERDDAADRELRAAGIEPGDRRLYPTSIGDGGAPL